MFIEIISKFLKFPKRYIKVLVTVGLKVEPIATPSHCSQKFQSKIKNNSNMVTLSYKMNFYSSCQDVFDFYKGFDETMIKTERHA